MHSIVQIQAHVGELRSSRSQRGRHISPGFVFQCRPGKLLTAFADMKPVNEDRQWLCCFMTFTALKPQWWVPGAVSGSPNSSAVAGAIRGEELGGPRGCSFLANI